jgi:hypothetical protein
MRKEVWPLLCKDSHSLHLESPSNPDPNPNFTMTLRTPNLRPTDPQTHQTFTLITTDRQRDRDRDRDRSRDPSDPQIVKPTHPQTLRLRERQRQGQRQKPRRKTRDPAFDLPGLLRDRDRNPDRKPETQTQTVTIMVLQPESMPGKETNPHRQTDRPSDLQASDSCSSWQRQARLD